MFADPQSSALADVADPADFADPAGFRDPAGFSDPAGFPDPADFRDPADFPDPAGFPDASDEWIPDPPDDVELVTEVATMLTVFAAQQYERVEEMRARAIASAGRQYGTAIRGAAREMVERGVRLELAAALRITEYAAGRLLVVAEALVNAYPAVLDALRRASLTERHAEVIVDTLTEVPTELRGALVDDAVELGEQLPVGSFRRELRRRVDAARAETLAERHEAALAQRRVSVEPATDGMAWLNAYLPAVEAQAVYGRLTSIARRLAENESETRTRDQLRADALGDLLIDGETSALPDSVRGIRPTVAVTVPAIALLEKSGARSTSAASAGALAEVEGVGPIPWDTAVQLCGSADGWMRVLTQPETGVVLSVGRDQYRPPASLRRLVRWRADRCMAPGCGMPAGRCEIDHTVAWEHGGETSAANLAPLCKGHHTVKHHTDWTVRQTAGDGTLEWTSPSGRRYTVRPRRRTPVFRPSEVARYGDPPF